MPFYPTRIRLQRENYLGRKYYFVTLCCEERRAVFVDGHRGQWVVRHLEEGCIRWGFTLHAFCAMPDHLHALAQGKETKADLQKLVENFKQRTGYEYRKAHAKRLWQGRYYDHILRSGDAVEDVACYIWWNPVRAGLCAEPGEYPFSGSHTIAWMQAAQKRTAWRPPWKV